MKPSISNQAIIIIITIYTTLHIQSTQSLRILGLFPLQGKSHFTMCESLMRGLAERGHQVDVYSHFPLKESLPNYTDYSLAGTMHALQNNMSYDYIRPALDGGVSMKRMTCIAKPVCELMRLPVFQRLLERAKSETKYDVVVVEVFLTHCYLAWGRYLNLPLVAVLTSPWFDWLDGPLGNPTSLATQPSIFTEFTAPMSFLQRVQNVILSNYIKQTFNHYVREQDEIVRSVFSPDYPSVVELQKDLSLTLVNYHHALNGIKAFAPAVIPVAGLHVRDTEQRLPKEIEKFLDGSEDGFVYVSFGSMVRIETFPKSTLQAFYGTFERIKPVRVLMKIARPDELPAGLPSNVITYHWLPQIKVLKHKNIKAFITHGGLMGTQESIYFGVPMIGFPLFGDQRFNMKSYVGKKLAVKLDFRNVNVTALTQAVEDVLHNPIYKESAEKASKLLQDTPMSPMDTAAYWVEYVARHGKDCLRSPIVHMPWWQASLLDVYAFIAVAVLSVLCIVKVILKQLLKLVCAKRFGKSDVKLKKN